ncbi:MULTISPECIES: type II secretion system protein GspD [Cupriavidus]|uniref:Type IV secretion pathway, outer membrane lipoprotein, putative (PilN homolog) n=1 Tax=Cupriavidus taiwanensis TaxID=164546 RepID=A0A7Z7JG02_9BURK|nr:MULTISPECIES: secretin N-terminal domain-containing protein [Cupriavidus]NOV26609.1 pilus assembly protein PilN [Cupriavidus necator]NSX13268.1 pilus assembly protein PilN [Cupriavidus taiwanensis]SOZ18907.1 type IV secretion pathway, outer membrane lipoprotein, putative precursor (pilN homolog) [Cupriavidus taiwanensis]SOZ97027.1 type IV secretion pathway, outer membrane lipoprotein, putative precursor (pilN homolog) [Cupriavidus taiwanensis]SPC25900.1 type IV secretion pathway, outer memb
MMKQCKRYTAAAVAAATLLSGCGVMETRQIQSAINSEAQARYADAPRSRPVFRVHEGAWLMGEKIRASKPQPDIYGKHVVFKGTLGSLNEAANWIAQSVGVRSTVDPSAVAAASSAAPVVQPAGAVRPGGPIPMGGTARVDLGAPLSVAAGGSAGGAAALPLTLRYEGSFKGFLDAVEAHFGVWSRYNDGTVTFFKTETRTFMLPSLADSSSMNGSITTTDSSSSGMSGAGGTGASNGSSGAGRSGQSMSMSVEMKPWETLQVTAKAVAGASAEVVVDKNLGTLTVTGDPAQCDRIEQFVKSLAAMYGKQVAIDVQVYEVRVTREDNYGLNLALAYQSSSGQPGVTFNSASMPNVSGSASPMNLGATIMSGPFAGSKAVIQALSTLGNVSQVVSRSGVTQNGKVLALQTATLQDYVAQAQTTLAANVGSTSSIQTATVTYGFTSNFLPKVVDGRILMNFDMTLSDLLPLQPFNSGGSANQTSVQLRTMPTNRFTQSITLKPGESLVLTGLRNQKAATTNNGVGEPWMAALGGGVGATRGDTVIAIMISARLL